MSTHYRTIPEIQFCHLLDGRLKKYGIKERREPDGTLRLEGPDGIFEVWQLDDGYCLFTSPSWRGLAWSILDAIAEEFEVEWVNEHDHRFWGFATKREWFDWNKKEAKKDEDKFYRDLIRYLRGQRHGLERGTVGREKAIIAKRLVKKDPSLMSPKKRSALLKAIKKIYESDDDTVPLTERDLAAAEMMVARTDALPKA